MPVSLVTGGAGFIGGHITELLLKKGHDVVILDNLEEQTHKNKKPYIAEGAKFIKGDIRNKEDILKALKNVDYIFHEAAFGGFTSEINKYIDSNSSGTAKLFEVIIKNEIPIKKIIAASSIAVYGEGKYRCEEHGILHPDMRPLKQMKNKEWEVKCPICNKEVSPIPTDEKKPVSPEAVYSISKYDQERLTILLGKQHNIPTVALRYFVTYGPRQSVLNPYTGVCSIFSTRIINNKKPPIYENGLQSRDFVFVKDIAAANFLVMNSNNANYEVFNVGTGNAVTILDVANTLSEMYGKSIAPDITGSFRIGDVRHMIADISKIKRLGYEPDYIFKDGIKKYVEWINQYGNLDEYFSKASEELKKSNIIRE